MGKYFGTDGVRGVANSELTPEFAFKLGRVGGYVLTKDAKERTHGKMSFRTFVPSVFSADLSVS